MISKFQNVSLKEEGFERGNVVDYNDKLFPHLFNIFEIAAVYTASCRPVSANVTTY